MPLVRQSTSVSFAATDGPAPAHQIPVLRKAREGVSYINSSFVRDCFTAQDSKQALTCLGTDTFRDDDEANKIRSGEERQKPFDYERACRWDENGAGFAAVQSFNPAPRAGVDSCGTGGLEGGSLGRASSQHKRTDESVFGKRDGPRNQSPAARGA